MRNLTLFFASLLLWSAQTYRLSRRSDRICLATVSAVTEFGGAHWSVIGPFSLLARIPSRASLTILFLRFWLLRLSLIHWRTPTKFALLTDGGRSCFSSCLSCPRDCNLHPNYALPNRIYCLDLLMFGFRIGDGHPACGAFHWDVIGLRVQFVSSPSNLWTAGYYSWNCCVIIMRSLEFHVGPDAWRDRAGGRDPGYPSREFPKPWVVMLQRQSDSSRWPSIMFSSKSNQVPWRQPTKYCCTFRNHVQNEKAAH
jgi:hypothetical protein